MKRWKKALVSLLTGCLVCGMMPANAMAASTQPTENKGYTYAVTPVSYTHLLRGLQRITLMRLQIQNILLILEKIPFPEGHG